jgi:hypothetical protein
MCIREREKGKEGGRKGGRKRREGRNQEVRGTCENEA